MAGLDAKGVTCEEVREALEAHVSRGGPLPGEVAAHLASCPDCARELALLRAVERALLEEVPEHSPPPELRTAVLSRARRTRRRAGPRLPALRPAWGLGLAAALAALLVTGTLLTGSRTSAGPLPDPAVVVSTGDALIVASNDRAGTVTLVQGDRARASLQTAGRQPAWFTEGVRLGDRVYLADAANDRVLELQPGPLRVLRSVPVPGGVAGLAAGDGVVYFKSVRGEVGRLGGPVVALAREGEMGLADVMDGVLLRRGRLYVTHHLSGEVCVLDPVSLRVEARLRVGGAPVALAQTRDGVLVLDLKGRLLRLDDAGQVTREWAVPGTPDKLTLNGDLALLSDRAGRVTRVNLASGAVTPVPARHPMDVAALPGGTFAVAEGAVEGRGAGVRLLDASLATRGRLGH
ncbi:hypothetical protein DAETH_24890 [Deinococcus aetherius]|uniref:Zinc-finger domain-containing protein n=1 Tax=Deinococcus aetherius TaxID=200252 RepID=A0ABN6RGQ0_9DEIO|nr:hypothetical protein [Deinococcus aetherius]BDP42520.1 hypothetical protein DAETH_24890 [Deinococcus aetherius]